MAITKIDLKLLKQLVTRVHRTLRIVAFSENVVLRQCYGLWKQMQELHTDVALLSETHLKLHERFFISNYHIHRTDRFPGRKGGTAVAVRKSIPHNHANLHDTN